MLLSSLATGPGCPLMLLPPIPETGQPQKSSSTFSQPGPRIRLSFIEHLLQVESPKFVLRFIGPFKVDWDVNPSGLRIKLSSSLKLRTAVNVL